MQDTLPLSELLPLITDTLLSCSMADCVATLTRTLQQLRPSDVGTLLLELDLLEIPVDQKVGLVEGLVRSGRGSEALSVWVSAEEGEEVVERILLYLATGSIPPNRSVFVRM